MRKKYLLFALCFLLVSACSSSDNEGIAPKLQEIASDLDFSEDGEESEEEKEKKQEELLLEYNPPPTPDLPDPSLSSTSWAQVNGPFGGRIIGISKTEGGLWVATTDNSGLSDNNIWFVDRDTFIWEKKKTVKTQMNSGLVVNRSNPNQVAFITGAGAGSMSDESEENKVFISRDKGMSWEKVSLELENGAEFFPKVITESFSNPNSIYVGGRYVPDEDDCEDDENGDCEPTSYSAVFISEDFGNSWNVSKNLPKIDFAKVEDIELAEGMEWEDYENELDEITELHVDPTNSDTIYAGTYYSLVKSIDGGENWSVISEDFHREDINGIVVNPNNPDIVYVRVGNFMFEDCWNLEPGDPNVKEESKKYCAGIYKSVDGGSSWILLDSGDSFSLPDPSEGGVYINDFYDEIIYAGFSRETFVSKNSGEDWEEFLFTRNQPNIPDVGVEKIFSGSDESEVFMAGIQGVYRTYDDGDSWIDTNAGFVGAEVVDLATAADGTMYATTYSLGLFKSTDGGKNWSFASLGIENWYGMQLAAHPVDADVIYATFGGGVYRTDNAGKLWKAIGEQELCGRTNIGGGSCHYHGIIVENESPYRVIVGSGGDQSALKGVGLKGSEDNGKSWRDSDDGFVRDIHVSKLIVDPNNSETFYATTQGSTEYTDKIGDGEGVFKSTDRGESWKSINNGLDTLETNVLVVDPNNSDILYLGTDDDGLYKSINGGESWEKIDIPLIEFAFGVGDIAVDPEDSDVVYIASVDYYRLANDRGVLGDYGVFKSTDGGETWSDFNTGLNHLGVFTLELNPESRILYAGTRGGGVYWISLDS